MMNDDVDGFGFGHLATSSWFHTPVSGWMGGLLDNWINEGAPNNPIIHQSINPNGSHVVNIIAQAFELQSQIDQLARISGASSGDTGIAADRAPAQSPTELQSQLQQLLGPQLWQAWQAGKNLRVNLDP